ncbi:hypothetical protein JCM12856_00530 [Spirochaeta dissipatitropha]
MTMVLLGFTGCDSDETVSEAASEQSSDHTETQEQTDSGSTERQIETDNGVVIIGMYTSGGSSYSDPVGIHVEPGTTIRFVNRSGMHSATAYHGDFGRTLRIPEGAEPWDTSLLTRRNEEFEITLTVEGVYDYFCIPHEASGHVGRIIVGSPDASPAVDTAGLPAGAVRALPDVEQIMRDGVVFY